MADNPDRKTLLRICQIAGEPRACLDGNHARLIRKLEDIARDSADMRAGSARLRRDMEASGAVPAVEVGAPEPNSGDRLLSNDALACMERINEVVLLVNSGDDDEARRELRRRVGLLPKVVRTRRKMVREYEAALVMGEPVMGKVLDVALMGMLELALVSVREGV